MAHAFRLQPLRSRALRVASGPYAIAYVLWLTLALSLYFRGVLELALPKSVAMVLQLASVMASAGLLFLRSRFVVRRRRALFLLLVSIFVVEALASGIATDILHEFYLWPIYCAFSLATLWLAVIALRDYDDTVLKLPIGITLCCIGWILLTVGIYEQISGIKLPGQTKWFFVRSASLTGSCLHYPIIMALLAYITFQWYSLTQKRIYLVSGIAFWLAPFLVVSRSGIFIVGLAWLIYLAYQLSRGQKQAIFTLLVLAALALGSHGLATIRGKESMVGKIVERVLFAGNKKDEGNKIRVETWKTVSSNWLAGNVLIGEQTGVVTNSTSAFQKGRPRIAESSVLQQLANFGLVGTLLYYALLVVIWCAIPAGTPLLRCVYLAGLGQTAFYQSIEVVPYITTLFLMPWIGRAMLTQVGKCRSPSGA